MEENVRQPTILLVEDDPSQALLVRRVLERARLANPVYTVVCGEDALAYLLGDGAFADRAAHPLPVLVLLDGQLPKRSGLEVLERLRAEPGLADVPVIMLSASTDSDDINRAFELGATSYLVKPVAFDALIETLNSVGLPWAILGRDAAAPAA